MAVDDNIDFLELLQLTFSNHSSILVSTITEVTEVVDIVKNTDIRLVITDYNMPELDGLTLAHHLRASGYEDPIILLTSYKDRLLEKKALSVGIDLCLEKQADIFQIYLEILQYLQEHMVIENIRIL